MIAHVPDAEYSAIIIPDTNTYRLRQNITIKLGLNLLPICWFVCIVTKQGANKNVLLLTTIKVNLIRVIGMEVNEFVIYLQDHIVYLNS